MPVTLSIKNAPDDVVQRLRARAVRHHRSLQGELMAIIESASHEELETGPEAILRAVRKLGLREPADSVEIVRAARDSRYGR